MVNNTPILTWRDLRDYLNHIHDDGTLDSSVAICHDGAFFHCDITEVESDCPLLGDILDEGHPYIETITEIEEPNYGN